MSSSPCLFRLPSLSSCPNLNGFSNSFFVSYDDSTDGDSYSIEDDDVYPNNFLSTDLICSIDDIDETEKTKKVPINYVVQFEPEKEKKERNKKGSNNSIKKPFVLRKGDWKCMNCYNINFGFRKCCNRCMFPKDSFFNENTIC